MNGQLNQQSRLFRLPRAMLTPIGQPRRAGGVFIEQFHNILSVFFCHMHLTSYLLSRHFFFVSCQFVTKHGDCFEQLDHADTHRVNLGVARGLVLECILYLLLLCNFFFLFSHQIIAKQLLSTWLPIRECHCHQPDLLSDVETQTVNTSFIFTKKSNVAKCFFDICNAEMAQSSL